VTPLSGLHLHGVAFAYGATRILDDIELSVSSGEFLCLVGPSGSGKSTLLRLLAGLEGPGQGRITWNGLAIRGTSIERGIVFQDYSLFPWMSVLDNVALAVGKAQPRLSRPAQREQARALLAGVGLTEAVGKYPYELSGGMRQRGAIARAFALGSPVLLLDEPFGALDPVNRARLQDLLSAVWQGAAPRKTIVFVTHDVDEALYLGDRITVLGTSPGRLIADLPIPFERPRQRATLFQSATCHRLRAQVSDLLNADTLAHLDQWQATG
jgi:NitT/TauT family transport system ATP-binding protein